MDWRALFSNPTLPPGVRKLYSPVNQAWFVMWHDQVLGVFNREEDANYYIKWDLGGGK